MSSARPRAAVVGAGLSGAACARFLADAGYAVQLFDKSRGVSGRLATRRATWLDEQGREQPARFDHGAPGFGARDPGFLRFVEQAQRDGLVARWTPRVAPGGYTPLDAPALWVPQPEMPALCRALAAGLVLHTGCTVDALRRSGDAWRLESDGAVVAEAFDRVVVAVPPAQAAPLLRAHRADWAQRAQQMPMLPGWVLMGVSDADPAFDGWDLAWPSDGPLAEIVRNDAKPGRERRPGVAHWVLHASAGWSQTHLEATPAEVQAALQQAFAAWLGRTPAWRHAAVHRWRYATAPRGAAVPGRCWWDAAAGLGVCGDALGGSGVEGAWCSGRALAAAILGPATPRGPESGA